MKKMKTLALLFLAVIISSTGLTSCIDENVDPAVQAIYTNQALLLLSQANLNDAEATYALAKANLQDAYAAATLSAAADASAESEQDVLSQAAQTAINVAAAAQNLSERETALAQTIAMNAIALETALANLELAKLQWENQMIALQAAIDDAYVLLASGYFNKYQAAKNSAIALEGQAIMKQSQIDMAQLLINTGASPDVTWAYYLSQQEDMLTDLQSDLAAKEASAASLAAVIADPSTAASQSSALQAMQDDNDDAIDVLDVEIAELQAETLPLFESLSNLGDLDSDYHSTVNQIDNVENNIEFFEGENDDLADDIADNVAAIASYDADVLAAEAAITAAEDAITAKEDALVLLEDAAALTQIARSDANDVRTASAAAVVDAQLAWDNQEAAVNAAASDLVIALNATDGGAQAALDASLLAQIDTDAEYATAKSIFDADPAGTTYTQEYAGLDGELGDHSDAFATSYRNIQAVNTVPTQTVASDVTYDGILYADGTVAPVVGNIAANSWGSLTQTGADEGNFLDIEADDDVAPTNEDRFIAATAAKLAADNQVDADQATVDTFDLAGDIAAAQAAYDAQVVIFEGQQELVDAAQVVADADQAAFLIAKAADIAADDAVIACQDEIDNDLADDLTDAEGDLVTLESYPPADMQADIVVWEHTILENNIELGLNNARLVDLMAELAVIEAALVDAGSGADYTALIALFNAMDVLEDEQNALELMNDAMQLVIDAIGMDNEDLQSTLDGILASIGACEDAIEAQQVVIAVGQVDEAAAQAAIVQLENQLALINSQIDGYNTLATKYWDLMQAALAG